MPIPSLSPAEVLEERLSDLLLRSPGDLAKTLAVYDIARIACRVIHSAAAAGNVQCQNGLVELYPHFKCLLKN